MKSLMLYLSVMLAIIGLAATHAEASSSQSCRVHVVTKLDDASLGNILSRAGAFVDGGLVRLDSAESPRYLLEMLKAGGNGQVVSVRPSLFAGDLILMQVTRPVENQFHLTELRNVLVGLRISEACEQVKLQEQTVERCAVEEVSNVKSKLEQICRR